MSKIIPPFVQHTIQLANNQLTIQIPSRKEKADIVFFFMSFVLWLLVTLWAFNSQFFSPAFADRFLVGWLTVWLAGGIFTGFNLLWQLFGTEIIEINSYVLKLRQQLFGMGWTRAYMTSNVKALQASPHARVLHGRTYSLFNPKQEKGTLLFDYGAKTIHFGYGIDDAEAKQLIKLIRQYFPQYK